MECASDGETWRKHVQNTRNHNFQQQQTSLQCDISWSSLDCRMCNFLLAIYSPITIHLCFLRYGCSFFSTYLFVTCSKTVTKIFSLKKKVTNSTKQNEVQMTSSIQGKVILCLTIVLDRWKWHMDEWIAQLNCRKEIFWFRHCDKDWTKDKGGQYRD